MGSSFPALYSGLWGWGPFPSDHCSMLEASLSSYCPPLPFFNTSGVVGVGEFICSGDPYRVLWVKSLQ